MLFNIMIFTFGLEKEMMDLGGKLDSMILEHDYGFVFTD